MKRSLNHIPFNVGLLQLHLKENKFMRNIPYISGRYKIRMTSKCNSTKKMNIANSLPISLLKKTKEVLIRF